MKATKNTRHIVVVGSGIVGATIAWSLSRRGAQVTVVDEGTPNNRATHGSFAWINAHNTEDETYFDLRMHSIRLWREMQLIIPTLPVRFGGTLNWEDPPGTIEAVQRQLNEGGNPARLVTRKEITALEPHLANPPEVAIDASGEGIADPLRIAEAILFSALSAEAILRTNTKVLGLTFDGSRVAGVEIPEGIIEADKVVLATGASTADILAHHGFTLPMDNAPGLLIGTNPIPKVTQRILTSLSLHVWQKDDGSLLVGEDFGGTDPAEGLPAIKARVLEKLHGYFKGITNIQATHTTVVKRPKPADGYPAVGRVPNLQGLYAATTHSGITLAPITAEALSQDILEDREAKILRPYRVSRFLSPPTKDSGYL